MMRRAAAVALLFFIGLTGQGVQAGTLKGVVWMRDFPIADATVVLLRNGAVERETFTAQDGAYTFGEVLPGAYSVEAQARDSCAQIKMCVTGSDVRYDLQLPEPLVYCCTMWVNRPDEFTWSGHVVNQEGKPVLGAVVEAESRPRKIRAVTREDGSFEIVAPEEDGLTLTASQAGYVRARTTMYCSRDVVLRLYPLCAAGD